jgi:hypothetical protein
MESERFVGMTDDCRFVDVDAEARPSRIVIIPPSSGFHPRPDRCAKSTHKRRPLATAAPEAHQRYPVGETQNGEQVHNDTGAGSI